MIDLKEGDNKILVKATDNDGNVGEDSIFVVYNKDIVFVEDPTVTPGTLFKKDPPKEVVFRAKVIQKSNKKISQVLLYSTNSNGEIQKEIGKMLDNGKVANGDDIPGDGTYSYKTEISEATKDTLYYRVVVNLAGSDVTGTSSMIKILIIPHANEQTVEQINDLNNQVSELTDQLNEANTSQQEIANQVNDLVSQQPNIAANGISEQGQGVWWVYENTCIPGGILVNPPGTKGGEGNGKLTGYFNKGLVNQINAQEKGTEVNSTKAIYLGPFLDDFAETR